MHKGKMYFMDAWAWNLAEILFCRPIKNSSLKTYISLACVVSETALKLRPTPARERVWERDRGRAKDRQPLVELIMSAAMTSAPMQAFATHLISGDKVKAHIIYQEFNKDSYGNVNHGDCKWYLKVAVLLADNKKQRGNERGILVRDFYYLSSVAVYRHHKPQIMNCRNMVGR